MEQRVQRLEEIVQHYQDLLEDDATLAESVDRLGVTAGALAKALVTVDQNQRTLINLSHKVDEVVETTPTKDDLGSEIEKVTEEQRLHRLRVRSMIYSTVVGVILLVGGVIFGVTYYAKATDESRQRASATSQSICAQRNEQAQYMQTYLKQALTQIDKDPRYTAADRTLAREQAAIISKAFRSVDCTRLAIR